MYMFWYQRRPPHIVRSVHTSTPLNASYRWKSVLPPGAPVEAPEPLGQVLPGLLSRLHRLICRSLI